MNSKLDPKESILVQKLRNRVTDVVSQENLQNDYWLIRWLRARDLDLDKAEAMLRRSMAWHKRNELDTILEWKPPYNYLRYAIAGTDNDGCPVIIAPIGLWDLREYAEIGDVVPAFRFVLRTLAILENEMKECSKKFGYPINQIILIFDFEQFSYRQINSRTVVQGAIEFFRIFESNYPELLKQCLFINTPRIFPIFFAIFKPFITARTMSKMAFFGPNKSKWQNVLLETIPSENLPPHYGGTRHGKDSLCSDEIWNDGPLPLNYFETDMSKGRNSFGDNNLITNGENGHSFTMIREEVKAGSKLDLEFQVPKSKFDSIEESISKILLKWSVKSEGYDVGICVSFKDELGLYKEDLIENHRIDCHLIQHDGSIVCEKPGTYIVSFDNTYSKRRKKIVHYNVYVEDFE